MTAIQYTRAWNAVVWREMLRFLNQRTRFFSALVRPLVWLLVFAVGFRASVEVPLTAPYVDAISYDVYILPGLVAMIQLFNGMQTSLSMVYDREMGSMRLLMTTPLPRWFLLISRLSGGVLVSMLQVYAFLLIAAAFGSAGPIAGWLAIAPLLLPTGLLLGAMGMLLGSVVRQLENFAGVMNFVIFPLFFMSSALYPLSTVQESSLTLYNICRFNPFTHIVELLRHALHLQLNVQALGVVMIWTLFMLAASTIAYDPALGLRGRKARSKS